MIKYKNETPVSCWAKGDVYEQQSHDTKSEHPNPQMMRDKWINLNGSWELKLITA